MTCVAEGALQYLNHILQIEIKYVGNTRVVQGT
jgi:hypothetical protein